MWGSWIRRGAVLAGVAIALTTAAVAPAQAEPSPAGAGGSTTKDGGREVPDTTDAFELMKSQLGLDGMRNNEDLNSFKSWLLAQPNIYQEGFYESAVDISSRTMTLLWHGTSPLAQRAVAEGARRGLTILIRQVGYTRDAVRDALTTLTDPRNAGRFGGLRVVSLTGPSLTNEKLTVRLGLADAGTPNPATEAASEATSATGTASRAMASAAKAVDTATVRARINAQGATLAATVKDLTGLDAVFEPGIAPVSYATSRSTDSSPFNAGGLMRSADGNTACTSGFTVKRNGYTWVTTARHCNSSYYTVWDVPSRSYGSSVAVDSGTGMRMLTGDGYYWMFSGAWNSTARKTVSGLADVSLGSVVCSSGGNSGVHCNLVVEEMFEAYFDGYGYFWSIRAHAPSGIAAAAGDSGAPVFIPSSDGVHVLAVGMVQGSQQQAASSCGSVRIPTNDCSAWMEFTSQREFLKNVGATLYTGP
jgi:hypothetical protein